MAPCSLVRSSAFEEYGFRRQCEYATCSAETSYFAIRKECWTVRNKNGVHLPDCTMS
jgi:hypothetical protein